MPPEQSGASLESYREYLRLFARMHLDRRLQGKLDASDIVQQTLLEAYQGLAEFRGEGSAQKAAWLRQILARNLANAVRDFGRGKRDVKRERSLEAALENSSVRVQAWLGAEQSSPSQRAARQEDVVRLAEALARLPEPQREAVFLRHIQDCSLADIACQLKRSKAAVAGLLHRGLEQLRVLLQERE
jgi:RNA polymerase sigma-70 factor (ECF subfamily)